MNIRDKDRFLVSFLLAFALHIILFYIAYKADLYLPQTKSVYSGPLLIQVPEFTPRTVSLPEAEEQPEITLPKQAEEMPLSQETTETSSPPTTPPADTAPPPAPTELKVTSRAAAAQVLPNRMPPVVTTPPAERSASQQRVEPASWATVPPSPPAQRTPPAGAVSIQVPTEPLVRSQDSAAAAVSAPDTPPGTAPVTAPDIPKTASDQPAPQKPSGEEGSFIISDSTPKPGIPTSSGRESVGLVAPPAVTVPERMPVPSPEQPRAQQSERPPAQTTIQKPEAPAASSSTQQQTSPERREQTQPVQTSTTLPQTARPPAPQVQTPPPPVPVPEQYSATTELDRVLGQIAAKPQESIGTQTRGSSSGGLEILTKESLNARRRILRSPEPELPPNVTLEGRPFVEVVTILVIAKTGFVSSARVTERSGNVTIDSIIEASLRKWLFEPVANPEEETVLLRVRIEAN